MIPFVTIEKRVTFPNMQESNTVLFSRAEVGVREGEEGNEVGEEGIEQGRLL